LPGGTSSRGGAINASGTIAGWSWTDAVGNLHGVVWKPGESITDLGALPGSDTSDAVDINDAGWVCGHATSTDFKQHAVVWNPDGAIQDLGCLPGDNYSCAQAIANDGLVVGYSFSSTDYVSDMFTWTQAGGMVNVGRPAGAKSATPWKVNNLGQAVCQVWSKSGQLSYSLWSTATGFVDSSACGLNELYDINDVGMMLGKRKSDGKLAVRHPDGSTSALPTYAGQQTLVCGMNNLGWVVGFASGVNHALLWRPVPEPSSVLALLCGIGGLAAAARKRGSAH
jgi:probable HAF family extracellular repeat protein